MDEFKLIKYKDKPEDSSTVSSSTLFSGLIKELIRQIKEAYNIEKEKEYPTTENIVELIHQVVQTITDIKNNLLKELDEKVSKELLDVVMEDIRDLGRDSVDRALLLKGVYRIQYPLDLGVNGTVYKNNTEPGICYYDKLNDEWVFNTKSGKTKLKHNG